MPAPDPVPSNTPVVVVPYDPEWPRIFSALRAVYLTTLGELVVAVEHVGSTAVPGLCAKPIVDIDIVIESRDRLHQVIERLSVLGYRHVGDLGLPGREAFNRDGARDVPRDGSGREWAPHNMYVCRGFEELRRHVTFRDWLRQNPGAADAYGRLKQRLASMYRDDRDGYTEAKSEFVEAALRAAGHGVSGNAG